MRILYFHQHFSTPQGSAGTRSYEMCQAALRAGHQVTMVCGGYAQGKTGLSGDFLRGKRRGTVDGIDVIEFNLSYGNEMGFAARVGVFAKFALGSIRLAISEPADLVFSTSTPLTAGIPAIAARLFTRRPIVFEVRDLWPELPKAMGVVRNPVLLGLMSVLEWASYHAAHRLVGLSPGIVAGIVRRGISEEKCTLVPNGCDLEIFGENQNSWRPKCVRDDQLLAVFSGTHGVANGLGSVLDAAAVLKARKRDDIRIVLVGEGREKPQLVARAKNEGLNNVLFLDPMPKTKLSELLAGADIGLQCLKNVPAFYFGTSPNKFFDYIASGLPVLNNYPGWLAGMIEDHDCGYSIVPDHPEAFANALSDAAENRDELIKKGQRARALAEREFSRAELSRRWVEWVTGTSRNARLH